MRNRVTESWVGLFMLIGLLAFLLMAFKVSGLASYTVTGAYTLTADFDNIGGLKIRAPVRVAGVRVGEVSRIMLNDRNYRAQVVLAMDERARFPVDTSAAILTEGLLGANYINLTPGFEQEMLGNGQAIEETHSALILENMIGHLLYSLGGKKDTQKESE